VHLNTNAQSKGGKPPVSPPVRPVSQPDKEPTPFVLSFENIFNMRAPKTNVEKRGEQVSYRLTKAEYVSLQAVAERTGESVNELARRLAIQGKLEVSPVPGFRPDPAAVMRLNGIGVSLRKIETACRNSQPLHPELTAEIGQTVKEIHDFVEAAVSERVKE
jgi:hypothetical protein